MSIETPADWNGLRAASTVARMTLDLLEHDVRPGVTTGELDSMAAQLSSRMARARRLRSPTAFRGPC